MTESRRACGHRNVNVIAPYAQGVHKGYLREWCASSSKLPRGYRGSSVQRRTPRRSPSRDVASPGLPSHSRFDIARGADYDGEMSREYVLQPFRAPIHLQIDYARELNEQQYAAVTAPPGPSLVIAGAGSGKTRTLIYRVAYLLEQGIPPERILLLTFTNKAAKEMMRRVADLLGQELASLFVKVSKRI